MREAVLALILMAVGLVTIAVVLHSVHPCAYGFDMTINDECQTYVGSGKHVAFYDQEGVICFAKEHTR